MALPRNTFRGTARTADRARLATQVRGEGPALLLLAGQANSHHWWDSVRPDFIDDRRTITFDYRGTGTTTAPDGDYSTRQFAADALAVLDFLGIPRADVYGTSMGGRVAQWLAADAPHRVGKLILGCTSAGGPHAVERDRAVRMSLVADGAESQEALTGLMYTPAYRNVQSGPYGVLGDPGMTDAARVRHLRASSAHDAWDALPSIGADTLILHGTDDLLAPFANAQLLAGRIPRARVHAFTGARHAYFEECRPAASEAVTRFLDADPR